MHNERSLIPAFLSLQALPSVLPPSVGQVGTMSLPLPLLRLLADTTLPKASGSGRPPVPMPAAAHSSHAASDPAAAPPATAPGMDDASTATATANDVDVVASDSASGSATRQDFDLLTSFPAAEAGQRAAAVAGAAANGPAHPALRLAVNRLNTPDCHSLPQDLKAFAKEKKIQLWAGGTGEGSGGCRLFLGTATPSVGASRCASLPPSS